MHALFGFLQLIAPLVSIAVVVIMVFGHVIPWPPKKRQ